MESTYVIMRVEWNIYGTPSGQSMQERSVPSGKDTTQQEANTQRGTGAGGARERRKDPARARPNKANKDASGGAHAKNSFTWESQGASEESMQPTRGLKLKDKQGGAQSCVKQLGAGGRQEDAKNAKGMANMRCIEKK